MRHGFAIFLFAAGLRQILTPVPEGIKKKHSVGARGGIIILLPVSETTVDNNSVPSSAPVQIAADTYFTMKVKPVDFF
jgi:hypothetical protein